MADGSERKGPRVVEPGWGVGHRSADTVEVPDDLNGMPVTTELRKMYEGFSELIYVRSALSQRCWKPFDAVTMCLRQQLDHDTCSEVMTAWRPCEEEIRQKRIKAARMAEEEQRKKLTEESRKREAGAR